MSFSISLALEYNSTSNPISNSVLNSISNSISNSVSRSPESKSIPSSKRVYIFRSMFISKSKL